MSDAAVEFLVEKLKEVVVHNAHLIEGAKYEAEKLENHLHLFKVFLSEVPKQRKNDEKLTELIRQIRSAVYDAEDIIDAYVTQVKNKNFLDGAIDPPNIVNIVEQVEAVLQKIRCIYSETSRIDDFAHVEVEDRRTDENKDLAAISVIKVPMMN